MRDLDTLKEVYYTITAYRTLPDGMGVFDHVLLQEVVEHFLDST